VYNLSYSVQELEVLIGDDASEDQTGRLIESFIQDKPHFRLFTIYSAVGQARGKANVLAQLAHQARGDYLFMTDADVQVPPHWIQAMLSAHTPATGVAAGITIVRGNKLFHHLQSLDWAYAFGLVHLFTARKIPVTAMGNNMYVTREAYEATGGYQNLPFSITEDYTLFRAIVNQGFDFHQLLHTDVLAYSQPVHNVYDLL
jgi:cellulose synthase/poly-beta-1,6-N-acetylglucosamine synthase-like glycosyltransferase